MLLPSPLNNKRKNRREKITIAKIEIKWLSVAFIRTSGCEPSKDSITVWISMYQELSPITLGVSIRLFVIVIKIGVENALAPPVKIIATTFIILFGKIYPMLPVRS